MGARRPKSAAKPPVPNSVVSPAPVIKPPVASVDTQYVELIKNLVTHSACTQYSWKNRGRAPAGYIKGVALTYARSLCRAKGFDGNSLLKIDAILTSANSSLPSKDALTHYQNLFSTLNFHNSEAGNDPLRAVYLLGIGLGMRESSGSYCVGWDSSAGSNRPSATAEAGVFQTSYDSIGSSGELAKLYAEYKSSPSSRCFLSTFKEGASCGSSSTLGSGAGADFQVFNKACPAFATEYAMVMLRIQRTHYGPINRKEAELISSCNDLLKSVQDLVERDPQYACRDIY